MDLDGKIYGSMRLKILYDHISGSKGTNVV